MRNRLLSVTGLLLVALLATGCPKGSADYKKGQEAELAKDYDTALIHYERALKANPRHAQYQLRATRMRFEAAQMHVDRGHKLREQGLLEPAAAEFEKALAIDPSSFVAEQELRRTLDLLVARRQAEEQAAQQRQAAPVAALAGLPEGPPALKPVSREPINLRLTEDAKRVFETIGKLAGLNVIFDPDFQPRRVTVELTNASVEQALNIVGLMTKTFWKPVTPNTIMVIPDTAAKRKTYDEHIIKTFYLSNTLQPAELNEIVQTIRTLVDIRRVTPSTANNAIIVRDTPDKVAVAEKIIRDIDQARPEVVIQVTILQARRDRLRQLGISPTTSFPLTFTPLQGGERGVSLKDLDEIGSGDYSVVLPSAVGTALLTDATTRVIQNPEVRATDGQAAKLRIGDKVPFATGSFQPGIGGVGVNPLVNTQFQFQDVGVNVDITPRVHLNREVSLKVMVEVSSVTGRVNIGGIDQPIFGQRRIEHDIRLREGEVNILGGIIERSESVSRSGWPLFSQVPFLRYLFSGETKEFQENEVLIVLTPRIVRLPGITPENLRPLAVGTDEAIALPRPSEAETPAAPAPPETPRPQAPSTEPPQAEIPGPAGLRFQPAQARVAVGQTVTVDIQVENVRDLFVVPFVVSFDPAVVELAEVHHGGFLGDGGQPAALVHRVDAESGAAIISLSRPPGVAGVTGSGTLVTVVFKGVAAGRCRLSVPQMAARDSQRRPISIQASVGEILVE